MGLHSREPGDARPGPEPAGLAHRRPPRAPAPRRGAGPGGLTLLATVLAILVAIAGPAGAQTLRIATWGADLSRDGPGLLLRDILQGEDEGLDGVVAVLGATRPDVLLLTDMDWDADGVALAALAERLGEAGLDYPHRLALPTNAGLATGLDLDGNGRLGEARDAQGYGRFAGNGGMAVLSRWPLGAARDLSGLLWRDLPGARLPVRDGQPFPSPEAQAAQRLSSDGHWIVPVEAPGGSLALLAWDATPPVFDGPEDLNGLRNADELALWSRLLDGAFGAAPERFVILGNANLDPADGEGLRADMARFLADPRLQDPRPASDGGRRAASLGQAGDPGLDTANWPGDGPGDDARGEEGSGQAGPGNLRVDYVLPATGLRVAGAGVAWPAAGDPLATAAEAAGAHRLVWVDLDP